MPGLADNNSTEFLKVLLVGDPGSGKTGSLTSLVKAGYKLRVFDFDNLLGSLKQYVTKECPDRIANVSFQTFTDKMKGNANPIQMIGGRAAVSALTDGIPSAYTRALAQLNHWKVGDEDFGPPATWGADTILVIDSLTSLSQSAFRYAIGMNPMAKEPQTHYFSAQQLVMNTLYLLASEQVATNVIVIAHLDYRDNHMNLTKGFPRAIGSAISSQIASCFNSVLLAETMGSGGNVRRTIRTNSTGIVDLKNPVAFRLPDTLPLETGLSDFFTAVKAA
jgi:hypothetical protein